jgi:hypothetical protein
MNANQDGRFSVLPWVFALVGLAVPMIGSGFIGWPFVIGWLVILLPLWWIRPLADADRTSRVVGASEHSYLWLCSACLVAST